MPNDVCVKNEPRMGDIVSGPRLGKKDSANYIYARCVDCDKLRWVRLNKYKRKPWGQCKKCTMAENLKQLIAYNHKRSLALTYKDFHTITLLKRGYGGKQIAFIMKCSISVHYHRCCRIYQKLKVNNAAGAIGKMGEYYATNRPNLSKRRFQRLARQF